MDGEKIASSPTTRFREQQGDWQLAPTDCICYCSVAGLVHVAHVSAQGHLLRALVALGAPVFSSPVWCDDALVLGGRDDRVHCIQTAALRW